MYSSQTSQRNHNHGGGTITLISDTMVSKDGKIPEMTFNSNVTIASKGGQYFRIYRGEHDRKEMLQVKDGTLRFFNVIIDGDCEGASAVCCVSKTHRTMLFFVYFMLFVIHFRDWRINVQIDTRLDSGPLPLLCI